MARAAVHPEHNRAGVTGGTTEVRAANTGREVIVHGNNGAFEMGASLGRLISHGESGRLVRSAPSRNEAPPAMSDEEIHKSVERLVSAAQIAGTATGWVTSAIQEITNALTKREPVGSGLTEAEAAYLIESGTFTPEQFAETEREVANGELAAEELKARTDVITRALTTDEVAHRLGKSASNVRHRQAKNGLYSFLVGRSRLYPTWQFIGTTKKLLPHLTTVVDAFPDGWHAVSAEGFMTNPQDSLIDEKGTRLSPIEWLLSGREPQAIVKILNGIAQR